MDTKEMALKRRIVQARKAIQQKYNRLKADRFIKEVEFVRTYKPLIQPLSQIVKKIEPPPSSLVIDTKKEEPEDEVFTSPPKKRQSPAKRKSPLQRTTPAIPYYMRSRRRPSSLTEISPLARLPYFQKYPPTDMSPMVSPFHPTATPSLRQPPSFLQSTVIGEHQPEEEEEESSVASSSASLLDMQGSQAFLEQYNHLPRIYVERMIRDTSNAIDTTFGIHYDVETDKWTMGRTPVTISDEDLVVNGIRYKGTAGLYELIIMNEPNESLVSNQDRNNYKQIIIATHVARRNYDPTDQIRGNKSKKYKLIIKPLLKEEEEETKRGRAKSGSGIFKELGRPTEYKYWNSVHELIRDLEVLWGEKMAGNTGVQNDIISIVEELYEEGYIKKPTRPFLRQLV
ncbi:uncharacterized protein LOC116170400 isoform X2 [Photinus pyralis]|uniref:uncharacterized protein LOC116170400 isoform X2 n=1 Tax=Photinus pyralis TaxID=7054 RepID=UPI00126723B5|nr:uncharacterized protein LOC116170400 isoform X2 [Photinus pyralis]